ncbi:MAG: ribbon-helix-helix protein, CopG family [Candidatus Binatia bacterium]
MTRTIAVRIDEALLRTIDRSGGPKGRSEIVREALQMWVARRELSEKVRRHREGYARRPVKPDEFTPVLGAQVWPK